MFFVCNTCYTKVLSKHTFINVHVVPYLHDYIITETFPIVIIEECACFSSKEAGGCKNTTH